MIYWLPMGPPGQRRGKACLKQRLRQFGASLVICVIFPGGVPLLLYVFIAVLMFGILIALHEFGHFVAAKACGVKVNEFAIGMGPLLVHKKGKETDYSLRLLPIGGFCAMEGEGEGESGDPRAFPNRPWWQRVIILLAGVFMNFLTGFLIILGLFSLNDHCALPVVGGFSDYGTAQEQGLEVGDRIVAVDGQRVYLINDIPMFLSRSVDAGVDLTVEREGERVELTDFRFACMVDAEGNIQDYMLGILTTTVPQTVPRLLQQSWYQAIDYVRMVWMGLGDLIGGRVGFRDLSGVVEITAMMAEMGQEGAQAAQAVGIPALLGAMVNILNFVAFISINLSVMNLLPIPALDGGQIFFMGVDGAYTAVTKKKLDPKYMNWVSTVGFALLMLLMLVVMASDILKRLGL